MKKSLAVLALVAAAWAPVVAQTPKGALVIVGGGGTTDAIVSRTMELAGGRNAVVVVLPQSSATTDAGDSSVKMWLDAGAKSAKKVGFKDADARAAIEAATLIWIPGGDQNRFMDAIEGTGLDDVIRAAYRRGAVVGGTSAGAAVMSERMMTGEADLTALVAGKTELKKGLGLWPEGLVDQHFLKRQRNNRLLSAVLERPSVIGVGIDEATAIIVRGDRFDVVGRSAVVVFDARKAKVDRVEAGALTTGSDVRLSVLREGMSYSIK
jgi:cyanophycinase